MSITETLKTTGQQVANTAADAATKQAQQQIDKAAGEAKKQAAAAKQTVDTATTTLTKATDVGQLKQGLTTTAVSAATSQLPSAVQPITNMAAQKVASTVGTLGTLKQKPDIAAKQLSQPITKTIEGTRHSTTEANTKPARRIGAVIRIGKTTIEQFDSLKIHEGFGHHVMILSVPSPHRDGESGITLEQAAELIGAPVEVTMNNVLDANTHKHEFKMLVTNIEVQQMQGNNSIVFLCQSPTYILDTAPNFETICDKDFKTIIEEMYKPFQNIKVKVNSNVKGDIPYVCRYNETRFAFIERMCAIYKQWCYFNGKELIIGEAENKTPVQLVYNQNCRNLKMNMQLAPISIGYYDYDAETHQFLDHTPTKDDTGKLGLWGTQVLNKSGQVLTDKGFIYNPGNPSKKVVQDITKANAASRAAGMFYTTGNTDAYELGMCSIAAIQYHSAPQQKEKMDLRIIEIVHYLGGNGTYKNEFVAVPAGVVSPPDFPYLVPQTTTMEAIVESTEDTKNLGRIKVAFVGGPETTKNQRLSNWIRVATPDAGGGHEKVGKNAGFVAIPEKGSHVKIGFENGDPHSPYVMSAVFHGKTAGGGGKGNNITSLTTKSGNTVTLNDDGTITVDNTKAKITLKGNEITVEAPEKITFKSKVIELTAENDVNIGGKNVKVDGKEVAEFNSSTGKTTIDGKTETNVKSAATVKVGAPSIEAKADAAMKVAGLTVDVEGKTTTNIKGTAMLALN